MNTSVYFFPFSARSVFLYHYCRIYLNKGGGVHPFVIKGFCDNDVKKQGLSYAGCPIITPADAYRDAPDATLVLCSQAHETVLRRQASELGFKHVVSSESYIASLGLRTNDIIETIRGEIDTHALCALSWTAYAHIGSELSYMRYLLKNNFVQSGVFQHAELIVTEKCSLNCNGCSNMMPYFRRPRNLNLDNLVRDLDLYMERIHFIWNFLLIGGEAFLHPQLDVLVSALKKYEHKFGMMEIVTNGTIVPNQRTLEALGRINTYIAISDYGALSARLEQLKEALTQNKILHHVYETLAWTYCEQPVEGETRTDQQVKDLYERCTVACYPIKNGRFYACQFLANSDSIRAIPSDPQNYVNLCDPSVTVEHIIAYQNRQTPYPGCRFCSGHDEDTPSIPVAEQLVGTLSCKQYD